MHASNYNDTIRRSKNSFERPLIACQIPIHLHVVMVSRTTQLMNPTGQRIVKNASILMVSQFCTWVLALLLTIFLSRYLGAAAIGKFHLANSIWIVMAMFMCFGMDTLLVKEVARRPAKSADLFGATVVLRCLLGILGFGIVTLYLFFANYATNTIYVVYIIGIAYFVNQFSEACRAILQGLEQMTSISLGIIAGKVFAVVVSLTLLLTGYGLLEVSTVMIASALISFLVQFFYLNRLHKLQFRLNRDLMEWMLKASLPYFMIVIFRVVYQQTDTIIISLLLHETVVGWYSVADRLFGTLMFIPVLFVTAVFPVLSRLNSATPDIGFEIMRKGSYLLFLCGVPVSLGVIVIADPLVLWLFGNDFAKSGPVLAIMGVALVFMYQNILLGHGLISMDRQHAVTVWMALAMLTTIFLDGVLVPWCQKTFDNGAIGGALAYVITEILIYMGFLRLLPKGTFGSRQARQGVRVLFAGLVMAATVWWFRHMFIVIPVTLGVVTYMGLIGLLRLLPQEDWRLLKYLGSDMVARLRGRKPVIGWHV